MEARQSPVWGEGDRHSWFSWLLATKMLLSVTVTLLSHSPEWKLPWNRLRVVTHNFGILWYSSLTFCRGSHVLHSRSLSVLFFLKTHQHSPNMGWRLPAVGSLSSMWDVGALQQALWCFQKAPENRNLSPAVVSKALYSIWKRLRLGGNLVQKCKSWWVVGIRVGSTGAWFLRVFFFFKDNKCHLFRDVISNFTTQSALDMSVVRRGKSCLSSVVQVTPALTAV